MAKKLSEEDKQRINRVAAMMAISNMGQTVDVDRVLNWKPNTRFNRDARSEICDLAGHFMETDEHEDIFAGEAESWAKGIKKVGLSTFADQHPRHADTIRKIMEIAADGK